MAIFVIVSLPFSKIVDSPPIKTPPKSETISIFGIFTLQFEISRQGIYNDHESVLVTGTPRFMVRLSQQIRLLRKSSMNIGNSSLCGLIAILGLLSLCSQDLPAQEVMVSSHTTADTAATPEYPEFTWDRIPLYMHIRKATSYTDQEIEFLAKFPLITFEKANGHEDHGSVEEGTLVAARAVKRLNPDATILYYRNVIVHYGGYEVDKGLGQISGALLRDQNGNTKLVRNRVQAYDLSNADLRNWWVNACSMTTDPAIDGIFLDGNIKALEPGYLAREIGTAKKKQTIDGYHLMMKQTREVIGPEKLMVANVLRARFDNAGLEFMDYFDGSYLEGFSHNVGGASYEEYVAKGIDAMQKAARQGKIIAFTSGFATPKNTSDMGIDEGHAKIGSDAQARAALIYPLAIFLVCAEKHSYFRIHEGYSANEGDHWMRWFPEYDRPLGPPTGPATKDGYRYTRTFRHATVELDIQKRTASIQWEATAGDSPFH